MHDAVHALLTASPDSLEGSRALRNVTTWLAGEHGAAAVTDPAEELAADLAEAFEALAAAEDRPALAVLDGWFHDIPPPRGPATAEPFAAEPDVTSSPSQSTLRVVAGLPSTRASQTVWHWPTRRSLDC